MQEQTTARFNMLEQEIRPNEVSCPRVLEAITDIDRVIFVSEEFKGIAYAGLELDIGYGQTMLSPLLQGQLLQALILKPTENVLEVGTGNGYFTALLARLANHVTSVEIIPELAEQAKLNLTEASIDNVTVETGDASQGWKLDDRIDVIVLTAAVVTVAEEFKNALKVGGRMLAIVGEGPAMKVQLIHRTNEWEWQTETVMETVIPPMINAEPKPEFEF